MIKAEGNRIEVGGDLNELIVEIGSILGGLYNGIKIKEGEQSAEIFKRHVTSETFWNYSVKNTNESNRSGCEIRHLAIDKSALTDKELMDIRERFFKKDK